MNDTLWFHTGLVRIVLTLTLARVNGRTAPETFCWKFNPISVLTHFLFILVFLSYFFSFCCLAWRVPHSLAMIYGILNYAPVFFFLSLSLSSASRRRRHAINFRMTKFECAINYFLCNNFFNVFRKTVANNSFGAPTAKRWGYKPWPHGKHPTVCTTPKNLKRPTWWKCAFTKESQWIAPRTERASIWVYNLVGPDCVPTARLTRIHPMMLMIVSRYAIYRRGQ